MHSLELKLSSTLWQKHEFANGNPELVSRLGSQDGPEDKTHASVSTFSQLICIRHPLCTGLRASGCGCKVERPPSLSLRDTQYGEETDTSG